MQELEPRTGIRVAKSISFGGDWIVLFDSYEIGKRGYCSNLQRVDGNGTVLWTAQLPSSTDVFSDVDFRDDSLVAWSWDGYRVTLDTETGSILTKIFTK